MQQTVIEVWKDTAQVLHFAVSFVGLLTIFRYLYMRMVESDAGWFAIAIAAVGAAVLIAAVFS